MCGLVEMLARVPFKSVPLCDSPGWDHVVLDQPWIRPVWFDTCGRSPSLHASNQHMGSLGLADGLGVGEGEGREVSIPPLCHKVYLSGSGLVYMH